MGLSGEPNKWLLGLASFSFIVFEFLLFRQVAYLYYPGISTLIITLSMTGFSIGNAFSQKIFNKLSEYWIILIVATTILFSVFLVTHIIYRSNNVIMSIIILITLLLWPFLFFGIYYGKVFSNAKNLKAIFLVSGLGLMSGSIFAGKIFKYFGMSGSFFFIFSLLLICLFLSSRSVRRLTLPIFCVAIIAFNLDIFEVRPGEFNQFMSNYGPKNYKMEFVKTLYTELIRTDVIKTERYGFWIFMNGIIMTPISKKNFKLPSSFVTLPYLLGNYKNVLVIGSGGGEDLAAALQFNVSDIVAVELNPNIIQLMTRDFSEYSGNLYSDARIKVICAEGRKYIQTTKEAFDLIVLHGTDTGISKSLSPALCLENYLYTKEAIQQYWKHLSDKGILAITRPHILFDRDRPLQILRLYNTIKAALPDVDIKKHILVFTETANRSDFLQFRMSCIFLSKQKYPADLINRLISNAPKGFKLIYYPEYDEDIESLLSDASEVYYIGPTFDNKPTFYTFLYWQKPFFYFSLLIISILALSLLYIKVKYSRITKREILFILLGIAYITLEINIIEKITLFLGDPIYSLQVGLASFLLFGGLGGYYGVSLNKNKTAYICFILFLAILVYIKIFAGIFQFLFEAPQIIRNIITFLIIGPMGFLSSIPFASALSSLSVQNERHILYALDGIGTVVGGILIFFLQSYLGFDVSFLLIALIYLSIVFCFIKSKTL